MQLRSLALFFLAGMLFISCSRGDGQKKFLLFFQQQNASSLAKVLQAAEKQELSVDTTSNYQLFKEDTLKHYRAVILLGVPGDSLDYRQQTDMERYVQAGGGLLAIGTEVAPKYQWPWHAQLMAALKRKPSPELQAKLPEPGSGQSAQQAVQQSFDGGRVAYLTSLEEVSEDSLQQTMQFAMGEKGLYYERARSARVPEESRFTRIVLHDDLNEPMELDVMPDGSVVYIERRGAVKVYNAATRTVKQLAQFDISTEGNYEDGMLGLALDPQFSRNSRAYIYYSPAGPEPIQRLSRFFLTKDTLFMNSENVILEVPVQRETCCHSGGSVQFGPDGLLYLSTGDNTSSKESDGYTPIDERPGRGPYDAQKSSGNTHDLRGKILRIKVHKDGSYSIPEGNLFPKDGSKGRPEIYVMGARNPFRITIDPKTNWLYWGDVGPDSGVDSEQGPQSYDEWNQARSPGNYGWPYFEADNKAYPDWDFTTNTPGPHFNPEQPVNDSPHNYGSRELPPARPAMIWYPYGESEQWPNLGTGSRSAMGGPIYYSDRYRNSDVKFPAYYDGKFFIYEWARSWIKVVSFDRRGRPVKIEPFLPDMPISKPIDMEFGPDGALYYLEYGANYFADNDEARLVRIEYAEENRKPVAQIAVDKKAGAAPLSVHFSARESFDYDKGDYLSYRWEFEEGQAEAEGEEVSYTFKEAGIYTPSLLVKDKEGKEARAQVEIRVGNAPPLVALSLEGNSSFYYDHTQLPYQITVTDPEDGSTEQGSIAAANVFVNFGYLQQGKDLAHLGRSAIVSPHIAGRNLIDGSDCKSCHDTKKESVGPTYEQIAGRYHQKKGAVGMLADKIIRGGNGNWGHSMMAAHPQLTKEEASKMVEYILSLADQPGGSTETPLSGSFTLDRHLGRGEEGAYYLTVQYTDKGARGMPALSDREMIVLQHPRLQAEAYAKAAGAARYRPNGRAFAYVGDIEHHSSLMFEETDLTDIAALTFRVKSFAGGTIELHLNGAEGPKVATAVVPEGKGESVFQEIKTSVLATEGKHNLYFVFKNEEQADRRLMELDWVYFHPKGEIVQ